MAHFEFIRPFEMNSAPLWHRSWNFRVPIKSNRQLALLPKSVNDTNRQERERNGDSDDGTTLILFFFFSPSPSFLSLLSFVISSFFFLAPGFFFSSSFFSKSDRLARFVNSYRTRRVPSHEFLVNETRTSCYAFRNRDSYAHRRRQVVNFPLAGCEFFDNEPCSV